MNRNMIEKEIEGLNDLQLAFEQCDLSACSKLIHFAEEEGSKETVRCVEKYMNILNVHSVEIASDYNLLVSISKEFIKLKYDEIISLVEKKIRIIEKEIVFSINKKGIEAMYPLGYDNYYKLYKYAYLELEVNNKGKLYEKEVKILFSKEENIQEILLFNALKYVEEITNTLSSVKSINELKEREKYLHNILCTFFNVDDINEYLYNEGDCFEKLYGISSIELVRRINSPFRKYEMVLKLNALGINNPSDDLVDLVHIFQSLIKHEQGRDYEISILGEENYKNIVNQLRERYDKLMSNACISQDELDVIINNLNKIEER